MGAGIQDPTAVGIILDDDGPLHITGAPNTGSQAGEDLTQAALAPIAQAAIQYWADQGLTSDVLETLSNAEFRIEDLGSTLLGETSGGVIRLDDDAAGYGWWVSLTSVEPDQADLFSVVVHEFGHLLGLQHDVMHATLATGERDLPQVEVPTLLVDAETPATIDRESTRRAAELLWSTPVEWTVETVIPEPWVAEATAPSKSRLSRLLGRWRSR